MSNYDYLPGGSKLPLRSRFARDTFGILHSSFFILHFFHSSFFILHSSFFSFFTLHSSFFILHSSFSTLQRYEKNPIPASLSPICFRIVWNVKMTYTFTLTPPAQLTSDDVTARWRRELFFEPSSRNIVDSGLHCAYSDCLCCQIVYHCTIVPFDIFVFAPLT